MHDIQQQLDDVQRDLDDMNRHIDTIAGIIHSLRGQNLAVTRIGYQILGEERRRMNAKADEVNRKLKKLNEESKENNMKRIERGIVMLVFVLLLAGLAVVVSAQDTPLATNTAQVIEGTATVVSSEPIPTAVPTPAATETPVDNEQPTSGNSSLIELAKIVLPWLGAIGIVALLVAAILGREALVRLGKSQPAYVREPVFSGAETGLAKLEEYTHTTETTIDDAAAAELKKFIMGIINEIRAEERARTSDAVKVAPPSDPVLGASQPQYPVDNEPKP